MGAIETAVVGLAILAITVIAPRTTRAQTVGTAESAASVDIIDAASLSLAQTLTFTITDRSINTARNLAVVSGPEGLYLSAPVSINVSRSDGGAKVTVRTVGTVTSLIGGQNSPILGVLSGAMFSQPVTVTGALDDGILSFSVGGKVTIADKLAPGNYHGVLTVVAEYN